MKENKKMWLLWGIILLLFIISKCSTNNFPEEIDIQQDEEISKSLELSKELFNHATLRSDDIAKYIELSNVTHNHFEKADFETLSYEEELEWYSEYIILMGNVVNFLELRIDHLDTYYNFVIENEDGLKEKEVDTFDLKKDLKDEIIGATQTIETIESTIESARETRSLIIQNKHLEESLSEYGVSKPKKSTTICSHNAYNCDDFSVWEEAQLAFEKCGGLANDVHNLDADKDGIACEGLYYN